jgi:hypothetical protein
MKTIILSLALLLSSMSLTRCDNPDVETAYDFSLSSWYLQKSAKVGEEVEIRFYLNRDGNFRDASYRFGYVQLEGNGRVYNTHRTIYTGREEYPLGDVPGLDTGDPKKWVYTLIYRHMGTTKSAIRFFVVDDFSNRREYEVEFNADASSE